MDIIYTDYTEDSISDRSIDKKIIEDALLSPDEIVEGKKSRKIAHKIIGNHKNLQNLRLRSQPQNSL